MSILRVVNEACGEGLRRIHPAPGKPRPRPQVGRSTWPKTFEVHEVNPAEGENAQPAALTCAARRVKATGGSRSERALCRRPGSSRAGSSSE